MFKHLNVVIFVTFVICAPLFKVLRTSAVRDFPGEQRALIKTERRQVRYVISLLSASVAGVCNLIT